MPNKTNSLNPNQPNSNSTPPQSSLAKFKKLDYDSLSQDEQSEGFIFHILSDFVSDTSREKLSNLAKELSRIYPCEIHIHICDDSMFEGMPKWCSNYSAYYRLLIPNFMPKSLKLCLYLDVDMLVFGDLRELWTFNLDEKIVGVIRHILPGAGVYSSNPQKENFYFTDFYFCSGLLLINLSNWNKHDITHKSLKFISEYEVLCPDQDSLCAVINDNFKLVLPYEYGIFINYDSGGGILWDRRRYIHQFFYTKEEVKFANSNPIIWHYLMTGYKPWEKVDVGIDNKGNALGFYWWQVAFQTPFFKDDLKALFAIKKENYLICKEFGFYIASLINDHSKSLLGYLKMPFVVWRAFKEFDLAKNDYALNSNANLDRNLAFELLYVATKAWGRTKLNSKLEQFITLPYKIYRAKCRCKKGNFRAKRKSVYHQLYTKI